MRLWDCHHLAGGPIDQVFAAVMAGYPQTQIERLAVTHPADDDNVYWVQLGNVCVQIDAHPNGQPPFYVEDSTQRFTTDDSERLTKYLLDCLATG